MTDSVHVLLVLDASGSMAPRVNDVIGGYNSYVATLKEDAATDYRLTTILFADTSTTLFVDRPLDQVGDMNTTTYRTSGSTALLDAIGFGMRNLTESVKTDDAKYGTDRVIVVVMTDGEENASKSFGKELIVGMIKRREESGNWTFIYMGADQNAWAASSQLGFSLGNTLSYDSINTASTWVGLATSTVTSTGTSVRSYTDFFNPPPTDPTTGSN